ncbi:MAG: hypothetical protein WD577_09145 [Bacteroidales bacterium]
MNYSTVILFKKNVLTRTRTVALSMMALTVFLCGSCDLLGDLTGIVQPDDFEPNNSQADAYAIEQGDIYIAHIAEDDADFFSFSTTHGSTTFDEVEISVTETGPDLKIGVAVYDSNGEFVGQNSANTAGADLTYTLRSLQSDETYFVRFSGTWGDGWTVDGIGDHDSEGSYSFRVMNLDTNDEFTGNHSLNDAHPIITDQTYNGVLVSKLEADYFSFTPTSDTMQLQVTNVGSDLIVGIALYAPNLELLGQAGAETAGATYTLNLNGMNTEVTYYLRFSGKWSGKTAWTVGGIGDHYNYGPYTFVLIDK